MMFPFSARPSLKQAPEKGLPSFSLGPKPYKSRLSPIHPQRNFQMRYQLLAPTPASLFLDELGSFQVTGLSEMFSRCIQRVCLEAVWWGVSVGPGRYGGKVSKNAPNAISSFPTLAPDRVCQYHTFSALSLFYGDENCLSLVLGTCQPFQTQTFGQICI